jgi:hypothetical protein
MGANAQTTVPSFTIGQVLTADQQNQSAEMAGNRSASNNDSMRNNTQQQPKRRNTPNVLLPRR